MRRREFIAGLTGAAAWPLMARAQQSRASVVGLLSGVSFDGPYAVPVAAIRRGLEDAGFAEGRNLAFEYRSANGRYDRLPELAADLVRTQAEVIVAIGASMRALSGKVAPGTVPIVFAMGADAAEVGLVKGPDTPADDVARPRAGAAGLASKRLELLLELGRRGPVVGYLDNSRLPETFEANVADVAAAASLKGRELFVFDAATEAEVEAAFTRMALARVRALVVSPDPFLATRQELIIARAAQSLIPTIYAARGAVVLGGLMSYGVLNNDMYRRAGIYAGRILMGATPAESPVLPPRFEMVVNSRTARSLRIAVPRHVMIRADEIID
jgi:putative ABC transport system substrate-binding protein